MNLYINEAEARLRAALPSYERTRDAIGIYLSLSEARITPESKDPYSIVVNILRDQFKGVIGDIYSLRNGDIIIVYRGRNERLIKDCLYQVHYLLSDEHTQLSFSEDIVSQYSEIFYPKDWHKFLSVCNRLTQNNSDTLEHNLGFSGSLTMLFSSIVEDALLTLEWNALIKTSAITKYQTNGSTSKVLDEIHVDIEDLSHIIGESFDVISNPYLKCYFKEFIDLKLLLKLVELLKEKPGEGAYLLNLNITTLSTQEFWTLAKSLPDTIKKRIIIAISVSDVFSDMSYYLQIREQIIEHGFKLCLDGLDYLSFLQIDRESLGFDLVRLYHKEQFDAVQLSEFQHQLKAKVAVSGSSRVILQLDTPGFVETGHKLGIVLFQGLI